jgi:hypothetical protein
VVVEAALLAACNRSVDRPVLAAADTMVLDLSGRATDHGCAGC